MMHLAVGGALCLSQIIVEFQGSQVSIPMLTAGVSLLVGYPLVKLGDRRGEES